MVTYTDHCIHMLKCLDHWTCSCYMSHVQVCLVLPCTRAVHLGILVLPTSIVFDWSTTDTDLSYKDKIVRSQFACSALSNTQESGRGPTHRSLNLFQHCLVQWKECTTHNVPPQCHGVYSMHGFQILHGPLASVCNDLYLHCR